MFGGACSSAVSVAAAAWQAASRAVSHPIAHTPPNLEALPSLPSQPAPTSTLSMTPIPSPSHPVRSPIQT